MIQSYDILTATAILALICISTTLSSQTEKVPLDIEDYNKWERISNAQISSDGHFVVYQVAPSLGDGTLKIVGTDGQALLSYDRGKDPKISDDANYVIFTIKPHQDSIRALKRVKTKESDMPKDSLGIYHVQTGILQKVANIKSFALPEEWNGYMTYTLDKITPKEKSSESDSVKTIKPKTVSDKNGHHLVIRDLGSGAEDTIQYVKSYEAARATAAMVYHTSGMDSTIAEGVYRYGFGDRTSKLLAAGAYQYDQLAISEDGMQAGFLRSKEDRKSYNPAYELMHWTSNRDSAIAVMGSSDLMDHWIINRHQEVRFSENGEKLFFYTAPPAIIKDTTLLEDEIVQVEVWSSQDQRLQTQQNVEQSRDEKKGYLAVYYPSRDEYKQLSTLVIPTVTFAEDHDRNDRYAFGGNTSPYLTSISWEGFPPRQDIYLIDQQSGQQTSIIKSVRGNGGISPGGKYLHWYSVDDTAYYVYNIEQNVLRNISDIIVTSIVDELDDHPDYPRPYGIAGWTSADEHILIYDRFDIWQINLNQPNSPELLTQGRATRDRYRIRHLDPERPYTDLGQDVLRVFNEVTREESFAKLSNGGAVTVLHSEAGRLRGLAKAKKSDTYIYTAQDNQRAPNLVAAGQAFGSQVQVSDINPQQKDKKWSSVEMVEWTSLDGVPLEGLVYKPEDFDSTKTYPMIVYFYEKNSDNIHRYWGSYPHRSIINPNYYASQGYIIFIPDIVYRDGYPGPSCYNAVMPGITHLVDQGYIDRDRIGMQGHSWGGYQTAYLATRTNLFACAESGAPVANMTSAYGGIRWGTGLSRMFQYERTQSRLGGTLWEYPMRYIENSPLFFADKIHTPMLLMHNDHDTAVPWYQGIELFVALRRLNKTAWMLNYNDEPHWPTKRENIFDFNVRMQQFFDHYLMGKEMPAWMEKGIPAVEKGYNKGY